MPHAPNEPCTESCRRKPGFCPHISEADRRRAERDGGSAVPHGRMTASGRIPMRAEPNIQNVPIQTAMGAGVRKSFLGRAPSLTGSAARFSGDSGEHISPAAKVVKVGRVVSLRQIRDLLSRGGYPTDEHSVSRYLLWAQEDGDLVGEGHPDSRRYRRTEKHADASDGMKAAFESGQWEAERKKAEQLARRAVQVAEKCLDAARRVLAASSNTQWSRDWSNKSADAWGDLKSVAAELNYIGDDAGVDFRILYSTTHGKKSLKAGALKAGYGGYEPTKWRPKNMSGLASQIDRAAKAWEDDHKRQWKDDQEMIESGRKDAEDLRYIAQLLRGGNYQQALDAAWNLDTIVRDEIPIEFYPPENRL